MSVWDNSCADTEIRETIHHHSTKTQNRQASTTTVERIGGTTPTAILPRQSSHVPSRVDQVHRTLQGLQQ